VDLRERGGRGKIRPEECRSLPRGTPIGHGGVFTRRRLSRLLIPSSPREGREGRKRGPLPTQEKEDGGTYGSKGGRRGGSAIFNSMYMKPSSSNISSTTETRRAYFDLSRQGRRGGTDPPKKGGKKGENPLYFRCEHFLPAEKDRTIPRGEKDLHLPLGAAKKKRTRDLSCRGSHVKSYYFVLSSTRNGEGGRRKNPGGKGDRARSCSKELKKN